MFNSVSFIFTIAIGTVGKMTVRIETKKMAWIVEWNCRKKEFS